MRRILPVNVAINQLTGAKSRVEALGCNMASMRETPEEGSQSQDRESTLPVYFALDQREHK